ncbi:zinc-dependent alcohol dehydrogenase [Nocardia sp. alder85J]|uniref:zinc-dependent alcohol dehydrogenase n=1 Tax=Nocardia sp. alder85J TaxID=2862949 RepID=UPI001CD2B58A|nr:alcohol dehydrogenase catalytic domain-containing protein [Nocardia sp. alder85J]MCX4091985.1 alcohol dehydrogenase catalytic domain-containing protein [Nocardia sp. alder85J]
MTRAAVIDAARTLAITSTDRPVPGPGEVRIEVAYCGLCGSDVHLFFDPPEPTVGHILGHEFSGIIDAVADDVIDWSAGDRVVVLPIAPCGQCRACLGGDDNAICLIGLMAGPGLGRPGGLADSVTVPARMLHRIPDGLSLRDAALTEPLAVAMRGVSHAAVGPGDTVVVFGAGPIGLLTAAALHARGIEHVLVVEPNPERRTVAAGFGVTVATPDTAAEALATLPGPAHAVIDCSGHSSVPAQAVGLLGYAGRLVIVGLPTVPAEIPLLGLTINELHIIGSTAYSTRDFGESLRALATGRIDVDALITSVVGLDAADAKIHELHSGASSDVKVLIAHTTRAGARRA